MHGETVKFIDDTLIWSRKL